MTRVSIIIPCDRLSGLGCTVRSVLAQTVTDWELILIANGTVIPMGIQSTLIREGLLDELGDRLVIKHTFERGISNALNCGLDLARSSIIARLDVGDMWLPWHLEDSLRGIESGFSFVHPVRFSVDESLVEETYVEKVSFKDEYNHITTKHDNFGDLLLFCNPVCHPGAVWRQDLLGIRYEPEFEGAEDWRAWSRFLGRASPVGYSLAPSVIYGVSNVAEKAQARIPLEDKLIKDYRLSLGLSNMEVVKLRRELFPIYNR